MVGDGGDVINLIQLELRIISCAYIGLFSMLDNFTIIS